MADCHKPMPSESRLAAIIKAVALEWSVSPEGIRSEVRDGFTAARWEVWRRLHVDLGFGLAPIARVWGCDHSSIIYAKSRGWKAAGRIPKAKRVRKSQAKKPKLIGPAIARAA